MKDEIYSRKGGNIKLGDKYKGAIAYVSRHETNAIALLFFLLPSEGG
jgi:hypothetical protein